MRKKKSVLVCCGGNVWESYLNYLAWHVCSLSLDCYSGFQFFLGEKTSTRNADCAWMFVLCKQVNWLKKKAFGLRSIDAKWYYSSIVTCCEKWWEMQRCLSQPWKNPFPLGNVVLTKFHLVPEGSDWVQRRNKKREVCKIMRDGAVKAKNNAFMSVQSFAPSTGPASWATAWFGGTEPAISCSSASHALACPCRQRGWAAARLHRPGHRLAVADGPWADSYWSGCCWHPLKAPAPIAMATKSPNTCPHTLGTSLNQAAGQQLWSQCVTLTAGDSFLWCSGDFWPSLGQTVENVGIAGQTAE